MPGDLIVFYGLRSPYAWLAQRLLAEQLPAAAQAQLEWVPYWDPAPATLAALRAEGGEILYRPMSRARHLYILADLKRCAARLGYPLRWPVDGTAPQWELPHRACLAAAPAQAAALRARLFAARWEEGRDICDGSVLAAQCTGLGIDAAGLLAAPPARDAAALAALRRAHRHGVFGLPTFVVGRESWWGVDRLPFALRAAGLPWRATAAAWAGLGADVVPAEEARA